MLSNKKNIYTDALELLEEKLKDKMQKYKVLPSNDDNISEKINLYKEISLVKNEIRKIKYNKINTIKDETNKDTFVLQINEDINYPEIHDITEDDNEIPNPYIELKKNIFNIPDSLQIIL